MGWYQKDNPRMQNQLEPGQIAETYEAEGWTVTMDALDWYKNGYFIRAVR